MITSFTPEQIRSKYRFDKHIWEGWTVEDFIQQLLPNLDRMMEYGYQYPDPVFTTKKQIKNWIRNNLPYTTKALRDVTKYFVDRYNGMHIAPWSNPDGYDILKLK